ncbi:hypothetical protein SAMN02745883_00307 [Caminicella sporogenes DSM 14501]|uniref:Alkaline phosphatase n=1 Tax=Caminicella sporogenes DSM 14501 TaxID=1121266 RepID=A0A1M6LQV8_9FIRM|nr:hypothetical protein [Caminicella sporogenes]SHJ73550.1 hypothetical protein SAMN02745883_00307 [Caminicella sporogenes DSM 14501]
MKKTAQIFFISILLMLLYSSFCFSQSGSENKLIVILVSRLDLDDIDKMPFVKNLAKNGAIGLMNTRGYGHNNEFSSCATIGSAARTDGTYYTSKFVELNTDSYEIYNRRTGFTNKGKHIINIDIAKLININKSNNYIPYIGALGSSLSKKNIKSVVLGNSDTDDKQIRLGALIGMDEYGLVDDGKIDEKVVVKDSNYPFGLKTNYEYIYTKFSEFIKTHDFMIIDLGDISRLENYKSNVTQEMYEVHRNRIISDIDIFIKKIYNLIDLSNTQILILSPFPSTKSSDVGKKLTPVILVDNYNNQRILTSSTTKRKGIIGNIDIAPYIAEYFNASLKHFTGKPFNTVSVSDNFSFVLNLSNETAFLYKNRIKILYAFAIFEIIISILTFFAIQFSSKLKSKHFEYIEYLLLGTMSIPFSLLILPLFTVNNLFTSFFLVIIISIVISSTLVILKRKTLDSIIILSGITSIGLIIDLFNNSKLMKLSFLGYDPIIGARYYGIGNEYMGILIGASLVFIMSLLDRFKINKMLPVIFLMFIVYVIGYPKLGANVGGSITAVISAVFVILRLFKKRLKLRDFSLIFLSVLILLFIISLTDLYIVDDKTHLANALSQIRNEGFKVIYSIIFRKICMNIKLLEITIWSKVLLTTILFLSILFYRPFGVAKKVLEKYNNLAKGLLGVLIACVVGFIVNDSGVVAAATAIIFLGITLMYLIVDEIKSS